MGKVIKTIKRTIAVLTFGALAFIGGYYTHYKTGGIKPVDEVLDQIPGIKREVEETQARVQAQIAQRQVGFIVTNTPSL